MIRFSPFVRPDSRLFVAALALLGAGFAQADTVTLKNGTKIEGKITFEAADMIRIQVKISDTIQETKTLSKNDIAEIVKTKPDLVAFEEIQKKLPVPSLLSAEQYRGFISSGPEKFLRDFPESEKKAEVEQLLASLNEELDKAERGFVKVGETWYSPEQKQAHPALVESTILHFGMKEKLKQRQFLAALRDFEKLEENYYGTPAYAEAIPQALETVRSLGQQLTANLKDVDYRTQQYQDGLQAMNELDRANTVAARQREADAHKKQLETERKQGIRWTVIDIREKGELEGYVKNLQTEMLRLQTLDTEALTRLAATLKTADDLIAEGKLPEAKLKIAETKGINVTKPLPNADPTKKAPAKANIKIISSYEKTLSTTLTAKEKAATLQQKAAAEAAKVAQMVKGTGSGADGKPGEGETSPDGTPTADDSADLSDLLAASTKSEAKPADAAKKKSPNDAKKAPVKKASPTKASADEEDEEAPAKKKAPVVDDDGGGGGISFTTIMIGITLLLAISVGVLKVMGIGGAKKE